MASPTWVVDTSSLILMRSLYSREERGRILERLSALVTEARIVYPREVVAELDRYAGPDNPALEWTKRHQDVATRRQPSFESVRTVLAQVPEVLDPDKEGVEEADPYVLAMALELAATTDVRLVSEEIKSTTAKMPLGSAAGFLRIPAVSLKTMLKFEDIAAFRPANGHIADR
jgi:hypothetical protein